LKYISGDIALRHDIDFSTFVEPSELGNEWRDKNHIAEPMIRPTDQDAINLVPGYGVNPVTGRK